MSDLFSRRVTCSSSPPLLINDLGYSFLYSSTSVTFVLVTSILAMSRSVFISVVLLSLRMSMIVCFPFSVSIRLCTSSLASDLSLSLSFSLSLSLSLVVQQLSFLFSSLIVSSSSSVVVSTSLHLLDILMLYG